jgi:glutamyl endopeptidase
VPQAPQAEATGPHTAVSNQPELEAGDGAVTTRQLSDPPSEGTGGQVGGPQAGGALADDGAEPVADYRPHAELTADDWTLPTTELKDIGEASFGPPPPPSETVHGPDDRVQITNTSVYPWRVHCSLQITAADNSQWIGTGWFIGPHTVVTAGHVVHIKNSGVPGRDGWVKSIKVMPGRNGNSLPYGAVTSTSFRSVTGWTQNGDQNYDYGAIILPTNLGNTTGWFGYGAFTDTDLTSSVGNISGYPGDQPAGTQWYDSRKIASVTALKVFYDIDTFGGQSGSSVYRIVSGARYGVAVHAYGGATTNSGTRITNAVFNNLTAWKA